MGGDGTTYGILYKLFPKVIIIAQGLDSYTTCRLHKYGWPNNILDTSRGATSHSTSSVNGFDDVQKVTMLADAEVSSFMKPHNSI